MAKRGKKYRAARELINPEQKYSVEEAVALAKKGSYSKFTGMMNIAVKTFADPKYNDQQIRAVTSLPHGVGKSVKIAAFVSDDKITAAQAAGADIAGNTQLLSDIEKGKIDFDILLTTPDMIKDLAKVAKALGPKGLMPSPKAGTVTQDMESTIAEVKKGRIEFRMDKTGNIHSPVGKLSFSDEQLVDNVKAFLSALEENKPAGIKGKLIKKVVLSPTMGPGAQVEY